jgi:hypothetical protein
MLAPCPWCDGSREPCVHRTHAEDELKTLRAELERVQSALRQAVRASMESISEATRGYETMMAERNGYYDDAEALRVQLWAELSRWTTSMRASSTDSDARMATLTKERDEAQSNIEAMLIAASEAVGDDRGMDNYTPADAVRTIVLSVIGERDEAREELAAERRPHVQQCVCDTCVLARGPAEREATSLRSEVESLRWPSAAHTTPPIEPKTPSDGCPVCGTRMLVMGIYCPEHGRFSDKAKADAKRDGVVESNIQTKALDQEIAFVLTNQDDGCPVTEGDLRGVAEAALEDSGDRFTFTPEKEGTYRVQLMSTERIVAVAVKHSTGVVLSLPPPNRHHHVLRIMSALDIYKIDEGRHEQGFLTSRGRFVDRAEALEIAEAAGQVIKKTPGGGLFSEDVW